VGNRIRLNNGACIGRKELVHVAREGRLVETRGADLVAGDWVALPFGAGFPAQLVPLPDFGLGRGYGSQHKVRLPKVLDADLALLLGMYASEGHTSRGNYSISITNSEDVVLERCRELWERCFGLAARIARPKGRCPSVIVNSKTVMLLFDALECGTRASNKRIPWAVMGSPLPVVQAFLQGLALDAYTSTTGSGSKWAICVDSPALLDDLQLLLRWWGIRSGRIGKYNPTYEKTYDEVFVCGSEAQRLLADVPFLEPTKRPSAERLLAMHFDDRRNGADVVPLVHGSVLYAKIPKGSPGRRGSGTGVAIKWRSLTDKRTVWPSRNIVERVAAAGHRLPSDVQRVLDDNLHFSPVTAAVV
jgi:hypothetical protein